MNRAFSALPSGLASWSNVLMSDADFPRVRPCGDAALAIELGAEIDADLNGRVLALDAVVAQAKPPGLIETIPTYCTLFVAYNPLITDFATLSGWLLNAARQPLSAPKPGRIWRFPVCYGGAHGEDLPFVAATAKLSEAEVVRKHTASPYRIYMMGFLPGFTYLGGLDPDLAVSRRNDPRLTSPSGTISIGGIQTGIQCLASPTGWHLIGRTPARTYDPARKTVFFLEPGDGVRFVAISADEFDALEARAATGELIAEEVNA